MMNNVLYSLTNMDCVSVRDELVDIIKNKISVAQVGVWEPYVTPERAVLSQFLVTWWQPDSDALTWFISWPTFALLSPALCLEWVNCGQLVCSKLRTGAQCVTNRPSSRCNRHDWARIADRPSKHLENCNTPTPSMGVCDCIRYKKCAKLFIDLRSSSKSVTARFATWNPAKWRKNKCITHSRQCCNLYINCCCLR